ncbi:hypothetical protein SUGI_1511140 [Cryptomeria japonica]|uniref:L-asparaginase n=1 Tax=Cryptomeria japonica TaxID=3369 RepID=A0AAD3NUP9_CRYJA|nr:hypothetical protein SUGI_1511140 [Cryptomeria japonica]
MEPINNLLAAVNCALPGLRSRPTILQRNTASQIQPWDSIGFSTNHMPDHDYCHQEKDTIKTHRSCELPCVIEQSPRCGTSSFDEISNYSSGFKKKRNHSISSDFKSTNSTRPLKLVAVHLGAGNSHHDEESLNLAKKICEQVMLQTSAQPLLSSSKKRRKNSLNSYKQVHTDDQSQLNINSDKITAESAVVHLVKLMEDHQSLNCGFGSNLNIKGQVECDASLMSDETQMWAGVGAVSGCKNPILLAKSLYDHRLVPRPLSLIQPNLLVSSGAKQWMRERCSHLSVMDTMKEKFLEELDWTSAVKADSNSQDYPTRTMKAHDSIRDEDTESLTNYSNHHRLDTVGAIAVDSNNNFASAISSGGILLKYKGRVGQAAVPGAGCWSEDSVAITTTGVGEYLTLSMFAKSSMIKCKL